MREFERLEGDVTVERVRHRSVEARRRGVIRDGERERAREREREKEKERGRGKGRRVREGVVCGGDARKPRLVNSLYMMHRKQRSGCKGVCRRI